MSRPSARTAEDRAAAPAAGRRRTTDGCSGSAPCRRGPVLAWCVPETAREPDVPDHRQRPANRHSRGRTANRRRPDRGPARYPRPSGTRLRGSAHRGGGCTRAHPPRHSAPNRRGQDRRSRADRGRPSRPGAGDPCRYGRAADPGKHRPALRQRGPRADARLRARHSHHHAARRRRGAERFGAATGRDREAGVPARRGRSGQA